MFHNQFTHKGQGRRPTFSADNTLHFTKIIEWVDKGVSLKEVADLFKKEFEISVSKAKIKDFIKKKGYTRKRIRKWLKPLQDSSHIKLNIPIDTKPDNYAIKLLVIFIH